ncbi:MAG: hypothetical protein ACON4Z_04565 [Planctomycetota bacterium]
MYKLLKNKKGSALVEYGLLIAGVALVGAAAVSVFGHKTNDLIAATATILPGAHNDDNGSIVSGKLVETAIDANGEIRVDAQGIQTNTDTARLGNNLFGATYNGNTEGGVLGTLVVEANG